MQKHERLAYRTIRDILVPRGFAISTRTSRAKLHVIVEGHGLRDQKTLSSSPGSEKTEIDQARQWAQRIARRVGQWA